MSSSERIIDLLSPLVILTVFSLLCFHVPSIHTLDNGLAKLPPMGWLTWERFRCETECVTFPGDCISERLLLETADRMVADGWLAAGYEYLSVDDCWLEMERDKNGSLVPDKCRFPRGMKYISQYLHEKGLKFGIYEDFGTKTCAGYPGSQFYLEQDANTFAEWEADLVKLDGCYSEGYQQPEGFEVFGFFLNKTGRPMLYNCLWPMHLPLDKLNGTQLQNTCNMWRIFDDVDDSWESVLSIINYYKTNSHIFAAWAGPGHWNDPDMLILGDFGLSYEQQRVQMGMWCMFAAPLIISADLRTMNPASRDLLMHTDLLRIDQDPLGKQASFVREENQMQLWRRSLVNSTVMAVVNANTDGTPRVFVLKVSDVLPTKKEMKWTYGDLTVRVIDVFHKRVLKEAWNMVEDEDLLLIVNPTGIAMVELKSLE